MVALLTFTGTIILGAANSVVSYFLQEQMPDHDEFLTQPSVHNREFALKSIQAELDGARAKWVEQRLASPQSVDSLETRMNDLEQQVGAADSAPATPAARRLAAAKQKAELKATRAKCLAERF